MAVHPLEEGGPGKKPEPGGRGRVQRSLGKTTGHGRPPRGLPGTGVGSFTDATAQRKLGTGRGVKRAVLSPTGTGAQGQSQQLTKSTGKVLSHQSPGLAVRLRIAAESVVAGSGAQKPRTSQRSVRCNPGPLAPRAAAPAKIKPEGQWGPRVGDSVPARHAPQEGKVRVLKPVTGTGLSSGFLQLKQPGTPKVVAGDLGKRGRSKVAETLRLCSRARCPGGCAAEGRARRGSTDNEERTIFDERKQAPLQSGVGQILIRSPPKVKGQHPRAAMPKESSSDTPSAAEQIQSTGPGEVGEPAFAHKLTAGELAEAGTGGSVEGRRHGQFG